MLGQRARFTRLIVIVRFTDLSLLLLCVARFGRLRRLLLSVAPDKTAYYLNSQTVTCTLILNSRSVVIFSFSGLPVAPARETKDSQKVIQSCPDKPLSAKLGLPPGRGNARNFLLIYQSARYHCGQPNSINRQIGSWKNTIKYTALPAPELKIQTVPQMKLRRLSRL